MGRRHERTFLQRRPPYGQQTDEKMLNITHIREMQLKTIMRYHLTPVRMAKINKSGNDGCWRGCGKRGRNPPTLLVGMQAGAASLENSMEVPQKDENRATL